MDIVITEDSESFFSQYYFLAEFDRAIDFEFVYLEGSLNNYCRVNCSIIQQEA